jgi:catechol 2,3-dioxygenase-like lactoylglutathione lyase family enzyme
MGDGRPLFEQVNLVVGDFDAAVAFYRRLGVQIGELPEWPPGSGARHAEAEMPSGVGFESDNLRMARIWHAAWRGGDGGERPTVLGFSLPSRLVTVLKVTVVGVNGST